MINKKGTETFASKLDRAFQQLTLLRLSIALILMVFLLVATLAVQRVREVDSEYQLAVKQIEEIQALASSDEIYSLTQEEMAWLEREFLSLQDRINHIEGLSELPFGLDGAVGSAPWVSKRYQAALDTLEVGRMLAEAGEVIANVGEESLGALDNTGIRAEPGNDDDTWLDVLQRREPELNAALTRMDQATEKRAEINESHLPSGIRYRLLQIDALLEEFSSKRELADDLPLAFVALGADEPVRYLVLFQNPAEVRPTGGFVGTIAFVEIERGQILGYDFHDVYEISRDYQANAESQINAPWAIREFVRPDALQYQDANWWPDFPVTARTMMEMTSDAGWPEVDSIVVAQPEAVTELIAITGPILVDVDGEEREINQENLLDEAERQRRLRREGQEAETDHKEVVAMIGEVLLDHLADGDRDALVDGAFLMFDALDRRDMQAYHANESVQAFLEERNWAGLLQPEPGTPTISPIFANVTGLKTSLVMQPEFHVELLEPDTDGVAEGILTVTLEHFGAEEGDPFYEGFQRWWLDVILPDGAVLVDAAPEPDDDPSASNGGAYVVHLDVGERRETAVRFTMPETDRLLIRRQPGINNVQAVLESAGCDRNLEFEVDRDVVLLLDSLCPEIEIIEEDAYSN